MRGVISVIMWTWLALSLSVYGRRLWRRFTGDPNRPQSSGDATTKTSKPLAQDLGPFPTTLGVTTDKTSIDSALTGIEMPDGLVPVVNSQAPLDNFTATFSSDSLDSPTVCGLITDELERIGFVVQSRGQLELTAEREGIEVVAVVHPKAGKVTFAGEPRFPSVSPDSLVLELST